MRLAYAWALVALVAPFGCASILGDFTNGAGVGDGGSPGGDAAAGSDASAPPDGGAESDGNPASDAIAPSDVQPGTDAPAPLKLLSCTSWKNASPTLLLQIPAFEAGNQGGNGSPIHQFYVEHVAASGVARIIVSSSTPSSTDTTIFTLSDSGGNQNLQTLTRSSTGLQGEQKTAGAVTLLVQQYGGGQTYGYYVIPDMDPGGDAAVLAPVATIGSPPGFANGDFRATFLPTPASGYYTLASYSASGGQYSLASWLSSQNTWQSLLANTSQLRTDSPLVGDGTNAYAFLAPQGQGGNGPTALAQYTFSTTGSSVSAPRAITAAGASAGTIAVSQSAAGAYQLAFVEIGGAQSANVRAGSVDRAKINSFMVDDLPALEFKPAGDAGFFDTTPFGNNGSNARWMSNGDLGMIGSGGTGGAGFTGLNFYVATPDGHWLIEAAGTGANLLPGRTIPSAAFDLASQTAEVLLTFDVAWSEQLPDGSTVLYFNQLNCSI